MKKEKEMSKSVFAEFMYQVAPPALGAITCFVIVLLSFVRR